MSEIIDRPWAIIYGPKHKLKKPGLMYGLGLTRKDAWNNAVLVMRGFGQSELYVNRDIISLKRKGMVARRVSILLEEK